VTDNQLVDKIKQLMHYRKLPDIIDLVEQTGKNKRELLSHLIEIQKAIYHLDHVLESEWNIIHSSLDIKWKSIYRALESAGVESSVHDEYCRHIYKYQKHELEQREGKSLLRLSMEYFYFYKSCDVKLLRRIIMDRYPELRTMFPIADWRWFDLVTEVNDDVEDVFEDMGTNNGNRFLLSVQKFGLEEAYQLFTKFLSEIKVSFDRKIKNKTIHPLITELTFNELNKTSELLNLRYDQLSVETQQEQGLKVI
jgi:hypothetical protein